MVRKCAHNVTPARGKLAILARTVPLRHAPLALLLGLACVRENPGFIIDNEGSGDGGSTPDDPAPTSDPASTSSTTDATTTTTTTDPTTTTTTATATSSTTDPSAPLCDDNDYFPDVGLGMVATLDDKIIDNLDNPGCMPMQFKGTGTFGDGLQINLNNCQDGVMGDSDLHLTTYFTKNVDLNLGLGDCYTLVLAWQPDCVTLRSAVISAVVAELGIEVPIAIGVSGSELPPAGLGETLKPTFEPAPGGACSCDGPCPACGDDHDPGAYQLRFNDVKGSVLGPGGMALAADFSLPFVGFDLHNLRSHVHHECGLERTHLDWYAFLTLL